ncbi:MAG: ferric reductase-like transmembrane domain-containing protein [Patescibacteria group bacterium]|nr:ferric reductase-like transmembrane domain-containing protein [Patescibacteria group bacterium]
MRKNIFWARRFWLSFLLVNALLILFFWWQGSGSLLSQGRGYLLLALGRIAGLLAAYAVMLQFVFMGRMPWLESAFGLDKLSRVHRLSGQWSLIFLLLHPVFLVASYSVFSRSGFGAQLLVFFKNFDDLGLAFLGLFLFLVVIASSIYIVRKKLPYEAWYFVHLLVYLAVFSSFWHQVRLGGDFLASKVFYSYWIGLYVLVFSSHLFFRFFRPFILFKKHQFKVEKIFRENHNTVSVYISGRNLENFKIQAGQFMILRFLDKKNWWQAHPFSLSKLPDGHSLRFTIKKIGDFTSRIDQIVPGTPIIIEGPYGIFTDLFSDSRSILLIAGGIGITPIRSLMEEMLKKGKDIKLLYANRSSQDIVFKDELEQLAQAKGAQIIHILSEQADFAGEKGHVDEEKIKRLVPDIDRREVYLCGPPAMIDSVKKLLKSLPNPPSKIHYEKFSL